MVLLQAAMLAGAILFICLGLFLIIGAPILTGLCMRTLWTIRKKRDFIDTKKPYYKDPLFYFPCLIFSIAVLTFFFYKTFLLIDIHFE